MAKLVRKEQVILKKTAETQLAEYLKSKAGSGTVKRALKLAKDVADPWTETDS